MMEMILWILAALCGVGAMIAYAAARAEWDHGLYFDKTRFDMLMRATALLMVLAGAFVLVIAATLYFDLLGKGAL